MIAALAQAHQQGVNASILSLSYAAPLLGLLLVAPPAHAANKGHLVFSSPEGCAGEAEFKAAVAARGGQFDDASATGNERSLRVTIARDEAAFRGSFQTEGLEGASAVREVHGATCQEVVEALAVVCAIELRGDDESAPAPAAAPLERCAFAARYADRVRNRASGAAGRGRTEPGRARSCARNATR